MYASYAYAVRQSQQTHTLPIISHCDSGRRKLVIVDSDSDDDDDGEDLNKDEKKAVNDANESITDATLPTAKVCVAQEKISSADPKRVKLTIIYASSDTDSDEERDGNQLTTSHAVSNPPQATIAGATSSTFLSAGSPGSSDAENEEIVDVDPRVWMPDSRTAKV